MARTPDSGPRNLPPYEKGDRVRFKKRLPSKAREQLRHINLELEYEVVDVRRIRTVEKKVEWVIWIKPVNGWPGLGVDPDDHRRALSQPIRYFNKPIKSSR